MRYQGSKKRIAKDIVNIINENLGDKMYVEPFMGGCNVLKNVVAKKKIGSDGNEYVASMWQELQNGTLVIPEPFSEEYYYKVKKAYLNGDDTYSKGMIALVGILGSFGGKFFNGYAHFNPKRNENHVKEALNGLKKDWDIFKCKENTIFLHADYRDLEIPENSSLIYCDPPYENTLKYQVVNNFDSDLFWQWCREQEENGNTIIVSEYNAPKDFVCVWEKELPCGMNSVFGEKQSKRTEKVFMYNKRV